MAKTDRIVLRKENVVKEVESEDRAKALEAKGYIRDGADPSAGGRDPAALRKEIAELKDSLIRASKVMEQKDQRQGELERELADTKEKLMEASAYAEDADRRIGLLTQELSGTKEQLEAALRKNTAPKKEKQGDRG